MTGETGLNISLLPVNKGSNEKAAHDIMQSLEFAMQCIRIHAQCIGVCGEASEMFRGIQSLVYKVILWHSASWRLVGLIKLIFAASSASLFSIDAATQQASNAMISSSSWACCNLIHALISSRNGFFVQYWVWMSSQPHRILRYVRKLRSMTSSSSHVSSGFGFGGAIDFTTMLYCSRVECRVLPFTDLFDIHWHDL